VNSASLSKAKSRSGNPALIAVKALVTGNFICCFHSRQSRMDPIAHPINLGHPQKDSMKNLQDIICQIKKLEKELYEELQRKQEDFYYNIQGRKVRFEAAARRRHKALMTHVPIYLIHAGFRNILTIPFIWICLPPALLMDLSVSIFQRVCFPIYEILRVRRSDYIVIDRHSLAYLNLIEKVNCVYCGYFNCLLAYVREIAARTEQYWCPIKHARRVANLHSRYKYYLEYGDAEGYKNDFREIRSAGFQDLKEKETNAQP